MRSLARRLSSMRVKAGREPVTVKGEVAFSAGSDALSKRRSDPPVLTVPIQLIGACVDAADLSAAAVTSATVQLTTSDDVLRSTAVTAIGGGSVVPGDGGSPVLLANESALKKASAALSSGTGIQSTLSLAEPSRPGEIIGLKQLVETVKQGDAATASTATTTARRHRLRSSSTRTGTLPVLSAVAASRGLDPGDLPHENASYTRTVAELASLAAHKHMYSDYVQASADKRRRRALSLGLSGSLAADGTRTIGNVFSSTDVSADMTQQAKLARAQALEGRNGVRPRGLSLKRDVQAPPTQFIPAPQPLTDGVGARPCKSTPSTEAEIAECCAELTEEQADDVITAPASLDFGDVSLTNSATRQWFVHNKTARSVLAALLLPPSSSSCVMVVSGERSEAFSAVAAASSQVIPAGAKARFTLRYQPSLGGPLHCSIPFKLNGRYTRSLDVVGVARPVAVAVSDKRLHLGFGCDSLETTVKKQIQLTNIAPVPAHYQWVSTYDQTTISGAADTVVGVGMARAALGPSHPFKVSPESGVLGPGKVVTATVSYTPSHGGSTDAEFALVVEGDGQGPAPHSDGHATSSSSSSSIITNERPLLRLSGDMYAGDVSASQSHLDFGTLSIGHERQLMLTLTNSGLGPAALSLRHVADVAPIVAVSPPSLVLQPGHAATKEVAVTFLSPTEVNLQPSKHALVFDVRGGPPVSIALSGSAVVPDVTIKEPQSSFDFGSVTIGTSARRRLTLVNASAISVDVAVDLTSLPEWYVAPPADMSGGGGIGGAGGSADLQSHDGSETVSRCDVGSVTRLDYDRESLISQSRSRGSRPPTGNSTGTGVGRRASLGSRHGSTDTDVTRATFGLLSPRQQPSKGSAVTGDMRRADSKVSSSSCSGSGKKTAASPDAATISLQSPRGVLKTSQRPSSGSSRQSGRSSASGTGSSSGASGGGISFGPSSRRSGGAGSRGGRGSSRDGPRSPLDGDGSGESSGEEEEEGAAEVLDEAEAASRAASEQYQHLPRKFRLKLKPQSAVGCDLIFCPRGTSEHAFTLPLSVTGLTLLTSASVFGPLIPGLVRRISARGSRPKLLLEPAGSVIDFQYRVLAQQPENRLPYSKTLLLRNVDSHPLQWALDTTLLAAAQYALPGSLQQRSVADGQPPSIRSVRGGTTRHGSRASMSALPSVHKLLVQSSASLSSGGSTSDINPPTAAPVVGSASGAPHHSRSNSSSGNLSESRRSLLSLSSASASACAAVPPVAHVPLPPVFTVTPSSGTISPGEVVSVTVTFAPPGLRDSRATLPLFVREVASPSPPSIEAGGSLIDHICPNIPSASLASDSPSSSSSSSTATALTSGQPYMELTLRGTGIAPQLSFSQAELVLPAVDLGVTAVGSFKAFNHGYDYLQLSTTVKVLQLAGYADLSEPEAAEAAAEAAKCISIGYPAGDIVSLARVHATVEVSFVCKRPISFIAQLAIAGPAKGEAFTIPVSVTADSCSLTNAATALLGDASSSSNSNGCGRKGDVPQLLTSLLNGLFFRRPITSFPSDITASNGVPVLDAITALSGVPVAGRIIGRLPPDKPRRERVTALLSQYVSLLSWLRQRGAFLSDVRPQYLLDRDDYAYYLNHSVRLGGKVPGLADIPPAHVLTSSGAGGRAADAIKAASAQHGALSKHAWASVCLQSIRLVLLPRATYRSLLDAPGVLLRPEHAAYRAWLVDRRASLTSALASRDPSRPDAKPHGDAASSSSSATGKAAATVSASVPIARSATGTTFSAAASGSGSSGAHESDHDSDDASPSRRISAGRGSTRRGPVAPSCLTYNELLKEMKAVDAALIAHYADPAVAAAKGEGKRGSRSARSGTDATSASSNAAQESALLQWLSHHCNCTLASGMLPSHEPCSVLQGGAAAAAGGAPLPCSLTSLASLQDGVALLLAVTSHAPELALPGGLLDPSRDALAPVIVNDDGHNIVADRLPSVCLNPTSTGQVRGNFLLLEEALRLLHLPFPSGLSSGLSTTIAEGSSGGSGNRRPAPSCALLLQQIAEAPAADGASPVAPAAASAAPVIVLGANGLPIPPSPPLLQLLPALPSVQGATRPLSASGRQSPAQVVSDGDQHQQQRSVQLLLLTLWLFTRLPQVVPREVIDFTGTLGSAVTRSITVRNPSASSAVKYSAVLECRGNSTSYGGRPEFTIVAAEGSGNTKGTGGGSSTDFSIPPGGSAVITIAGKTMVTKPVHAKLTLLPAPSSTAAASLPPIVYALRSVVTKRLPVLVKELEVQLYGTATTEVEVPCPLPVDGFYDVTIIPSAPVTADGGVDDEVHSAAPHLLREANPSPFLLPPQPKWPSHASLSGASTHDPSPVAGGHNHRVAYGAVTSGGAAPLPPFFWCKHSVVALHPGRGKRMHLHFQPLLPGRHWVTLLLSDQQGRAEVAVELHGLAIVPQPALTSSFAPGPLGGRVTVSSPPAHHAASPSPAGGSRCIGTKTKA